MRARVFIRSVLPGLLLAAVLAGCGQSSGGRSPSVAAVPLADRLHVLAQFTRCDPGANRYCAVQFVVGGAYGSAQAMLKSERRYLQAQGWGLVNAQTGDEHAAESPGHRFHLVFATAALDLKDWDLGWIKRSRSLAHALSQTMIDRRPALSMMVEPGAS